MMKAPMLILILSIILAMAFFTLEERKVLGYSQLRKGPNKIAIMGVLQPIADAAKLLTKTSIFPNQVNFYLFLLAPNISISLSLLIWLILPSMLMFMNTPFSIIWFLILSSLTVYSILFSGWASNSKYSLIGALRALAQTISYEVTMTLIILCYLLLWHTSSFKYLPMSSSFILHTLAPIWMIIALAETSRSPFDLPEGESELVSGFNTELSGPLFTFFFMAETLNILMMSVISTILLFPWPPLLSPLKFMTFAYFFIWVRSALPRLRYDMLMSLTWKTILPFSLTLFMMALLLS
uniref:NADH-ubiquinone oxidoreductase chain 1 n=1 Tax=Diurodrilus subterraneus TaxID=1318637 RepID=M9W971_9ANNE|nr:NADH dehydrogenase subunit 1 [Diurodrilus subterraneus]